MPVPFANPALQYPGGGPGGYTAYPPQYQQYPTGVAGDIATGVGVAGDLYGLYQSAHLQGAAQDVFRQSDPFAGYRPYYGQQLYNLMQDPSSVAKLPGYQFMMEQGTEAINRSAAAPGGVGFGSTADKALLEKYGQGLADQFYQQQVATLSGLAGANIPPANPAQALQGLGAAQGSLGASALGMTNQTMQLLSRLFPGSSMPGGVSPIDLQSYSDQSLYGTYGAPPNTAMGGDPTYQAALGMMQAPGGSVDVGQPGDYTGGMDLTGLFGP